MTLESINPANNEKIKTYPQMSSGEVESIIQDVHEEFKEWKTVALSEKKRLLIKAADILLARKEKEAHLMAIEMGKPLKQGQAEIEKCALGCRYYAENAALFLQPEIVATEALKSYIAFEPIGIVLAIMPWNYPFWQVFRFAAPALMAGNGAVLKHAANVTGCALSIEEIFREAGFPQNIFRSLLIRNPEVKAVINNPHVRAVTLTGSTRAGRAVAAEAGQALKKTVLELGGSDPFIVLEDADIDKAADFAFKARLLNAGQSCIAAKRFIIVESVRAAFEQKLLEKMSAVRMGDPLDESNEMGPMARVDLRDELHQQVQNSVDKGAKLLLGGKIPTQPGAFYPPTILTGDSGHWRGC